MELVDDDDMKTVIALYCLPRNVESVELFAKLANVEPVQNSTPLNQQYEVQDLYIKVLRASVDRRSSAHGFDFDLNVGWVELCDYGATSTWGDNPHNALIMYNNPSPASLLQIHLLVIGTNIDDKERPYNGVVLIMRVKILITLSSIRSQMILTMKVHAMMIMYTPFHPGPRLILFVFS